MIYTHIYKHVDVCHSAKYSTARISDSIMYEANTHPDIIATDSQAGRDLNRVPGHPH